MYRPRGISERLLGMVAERAGFEYSGGAEGRDGPDGTEGTGRVEA
jgi:hypothetical protein